jgi:multiple sugar transport system substrate-binding protein
MLKSRLYFLFSIAKKEMYMVLKRLYPLFVMFLIVTFLAACASAAQPTQALKPADTAAPAANSQSGSGSQKTLRVWITWGDNPAQLQGLFDEYGKANNVKVEVTSPVTDDKVLAGLTGSEPPDVLVLGSGDLVKSWEREGLVTQLDDLVTQNAIDVNDIYPAPLSQCKDHKGHLICLPWGTDVPALFWNKDLFEEAGLDPEKPPKTMEELAEFADKLVKKDDTGKLTQVGFIPDFSWTHTDLYVSMLGGDRYSSDGTQLTVNQQPMIDALKWQQQFYSKYGADNVLAFTSALGGYMSPDQGFVAEKIAMMVDGEWQVGPNYMKHFKPDLHYGVAPFPPPADHPERAGTTIAQGTVVVIPAKVHDATASAKLLAWMVSPKVLADEMVVNYNLPTSTKSAADPRFRQNTDFGIFMDLEAGKNAKPSITSPISTELNQELAQVEEQVLHAGKDPKPLLDAVQAKFESKLADSLK